MEENNEMRPAKGEYCPYCYTILHSKKGLIKQHCAICSSKYCENCSQGGLCQEHFQKLSLESQNRVYRVNGIYDAISITFLIPIIVIVFLLIFLGNSFILPYFNYLDQLNNFPINILLVVTLMICIILIVFLGSIALFMLPLQYLKVKKIRKIALQDYKDNRKSSPNDLFKINYSNVGNRKIKLMLEISVLIIIPLFFIQVENIRIIYISVLSVIYVFLLILIVLWPNKLNKKIKI